MKKQAIFATDELMDIERTKNTYTQTNIHITHSHTALIKTPAIFHMQQKNVHSTKNSNVFCPQMFTN
jgi:hypothetical protein